MSLRPLLREPIFYVAMAGSIAVVLWLAGLHGLDFAVYRDGARAFLGMDGGDLYARDLHEVTNGNDLPFTYPPIAAALFTPFAALEFTPGFYIHTAVQLAGLVIVAAIILRDVIRRSGREVRSTKIMALLFAGTVLAIGISGPWRDGFGFGQINAMLIAVIVVDALVVRRPWPRGLLTGLAAGVKLTPLAMGLYYLAQRDWKALFWMAGGFFGSVGLGFLFFFNKSVTFWGSAMWDTSRVGTADFVYCVNLRSLAYHLNLSETGRDIFWFVGSAAVIAAGYFVIRRLLLTDDQLTAVGVAALVMLVISPISWFHHWVWFVLFIPAVLFTRPVAGRTSALRIGYAALLYFAFYMAITRWTAFFTGEAIDRGPMALELLSSAPMALSLGCWLFYLANVRRAQSEPALDDKPEPELVQK